MDAMITYNWPGNVRELKNTIETAAALVPNFTIDYGAIITLIQPYNSSMNSRNLPVSLGKTPGDLDREIILRALFELKRDIIELKEIVADKSDSPRNVRVEEIRTIETLEKEAIVNALSRTNGNKRSTARLLGISERTLYRKIKEYDLPL
jgi:DNA-binding NtrC family response regulator